MIRRAIDDALLILIKLLERRAFQFDFMGEPTAAGAGAAAEPRFFQYEPAIPAAPRSAHEVAPTRARGSFARDPSAVARESRPPLLMSQNDVFGRRRRRRARQMAAAGWLADVAGARFLNGWLESQVSRSSRRTDASSGHRARQTHTHTHNASQALLDVMASLQFLGFALAPVGPSFSQRKGQ